MAEMTKRKKVYSVFQHISGSYDAANGRISLGMEKAWKKDLIKGITENTPQGAALLDVCCGTGDIALALGSVRPDATVTGLDFSPAMLDVAREKGKGRTNVTWQQGDAMELPFPDDTFHDACISFGLRNTPDYGQVLSEMARVVAPGGKVWCLDSFVPTSMWIRPFYSLYFHYVMPILGGGLSHRAEYQWLWQSTQEFVSKDELTELFRRTGLVEVSAVSHLFGSCVMHSGKKRAK